MSHGRTDAASVERPLVDVALERSRINFSWFLKLRWAAVLGQLATIAAVSLHLDIVLPIGAFAVLLGIEVLVTLGLAFWFRLHSRRETWPDWAARGEAILGSTMAIDIVLLGGLLFVSGGPTNPFGIFFLVNLTLAAVVLRSAWAWFLTGLTFVSFVALFPFHIALPPLGDTGGQTILHVLRGDVSALDPLQLYHGGKLVAFGAVAVIMVYFITRLTAELSRLEGELGAIRQRRAEAEKLRALGTLAAGAAHELASPLSTIAVVARELELEIARGDTGATVEEDVKLVRAEVARCRDILDQMTVGAGGAIGEELAPVVFGDLLDDVLGGLRDASRVELRLAAGVRETGVVAPRKALVRAVRGIIKNALDALDALDAIDAIALDAINVADRSDASAGASGDRSTATVRVEGSVHGTMLRIAVADRGAGMPPEVLSRVGQPFFTTKEPGQGMGLGIFLSKAVVERLGGELRIDSVPGAGTTVTISVPIEELPEPS